MAKTQFNAAYIIAEAQEEINIAMRRKLQLEACASAINADISTALRIMGSTPLAYVSAGGWGEHRHAVIMSRVTVSGLKKDRKLTNILSRALECGAMAKQGSDYVGDEMIERTYRFDLPNGGRLDIEARVASDSKTCRKVVVEVRRETIERPIYAIECN